MSKLWGHAASFLFAKLSVRSSKFYEAIHYANLLK